MNDILLKEGMDLKLTPYKVLPTSKTDGFVQYIESSPIDEIMQEEESIMNFLRCKAPSISVWESYGIDPHVMDNYVRSCAGYCVITYILGVGDRHLHNILITNNGNLFHIDYGFILGKDPKPFTPPMKLTMEMIEGMGGKDTSNYKKFEKLCLETFIQLRCHSNQIINLFKMNVVSSIPLKDFKPETATNKLVKSFRLEMSEEEAKNHFLKIIHKSLTSKAGKVYELFHRLGQIFRK